MSLAAKDLAPFRALSREQREALAAAFADSVQSVSPQRAERLIAIVRRHFFDRVPSSRLIAELCVSRQRFFSDRREAHRRLGHLLERLSLQKTAVVTDIPQLMLAQARSLYRVGQSRRAVHLLERLDDTNLDEGDRFDALRLLTNALDDTNDLRSSAEIIVQRARRWGEENASHSMSVRLARIAEHWTLAVLALADGSNGGEFIDHVERSIGVVDTVRDWRGRSTIGALCRLLAESVTPLMGRGRHDRAKTAIAAAQVMLQGGHDISPAVLGEVLAMSAQLHWYEPASLQRSRVERRTAYTSVRDSGAMRTAWNCQYFETRDYLLRQDGERALTLAEELYHSVQASESPGWRQLAQAALVSVYLATGRLDEALQFMPPEDKAAASDTSSLAYCELEAARNNFSGAYARASHLANTFERRGMDNLRMSALHLRARAAHYLRLPTAVTDIEDAVALAQSLSFPEPVRLRSLYKDAVMITGRTRHSDVLRDLLSTFESVDTVSAEPEDISALTARQRQIARLAASGFTNPRIAYELGISLGTVRRHLDAVFGHLGISSRLQLANRLSPPSP